VQRSREELLRWRIWETVDERAMLVGRWTLVAVNVGRISEYFGGVGAARERLA
jgi:hypothetical protein